MGKAAEEREVKPAKLWRGRKVLTLKEREKMKPDLPSEEEWVEQINKNLDKKKKTS
jgi:hypothetical protein